MHQSRVVILLINNDYNLKYYGISIVKLFWETEVTVSGNSKHLVIYSQKEEIPVSDAIMDINQLSQGVAIVKEIIV